jgi:hypothetical protein
MAGATGAPRSFGNNEDLRGFGAILSDLIGSILLQTRLGQDCPSRDRLDGRIGVVGQQRRRLARPRLDSDPCHSPSSTYIIRYVRHNFAIHIEYVICRCAGGGIPVAAHRAIMAHPDYGDAGIYREGHRASSKAKPRRDATFVPRSSERLICRCRGQIGPESDGAAPTSTRSHKASGHLGNNSPGMVPLCLLLRDSPTSTLVDFLIGRPSGLSYRTARFSRRNSSSSRRSRGN